MQNKCICLYKYTSQHLRKTSDFKIDIENVTCNVTGDETSTEGEGANAKTYSSKYLECKANDNTYTTKTVSLRKMSQ